MNIGKTCISPFNSNSLHYSCEIHPYVSEFFYLCSDDQIVTAYGKITYYVFVVPSCAAFSSLESGANI